MKKRLLIAAAFLLCASLLTGCQCAHEWGEADCTTPKTCTVCGETEGEVLKHTWAEATCFAPKTCTVCGETEGESLKHTWEEATCSAPKTCTACGEAEGEALAHEWVDANYQAPQTCSVCGATEGEPLTASFTKHGLSVLPVDTTKEYSYITSYTNNPSQKTTVAVTLSDYSRFASDETHEAAEGYEWITLTTTMRFDETAGAQGVNIRTTNENYYDIEGFDGSGYVVSDGVYGFTVNYNGTDYGECRYTTANMHFGNSGGSFTVYFRVPVGYDGVVVGLRDAGVEWGAGQYIYDIADENTLFFRLT